MTTKPKLPARSTPANKADIVTLTKRVLELETYMDRQHARMRELAARIVRLEARLEATTQ